MRIAELLHELRRMRGRLTGLVATAAVLLCPAVAGAEAVTVVVDSPAGLVVVGDAANNQLNLRTDAPRNRLLIFDRQGRITVPAGNACYVTTIGSVLGASCPVKTMKFFGGPGNDTFTVDKSNTPNKVTVRLDEHGGEGDDTLEGGNEKDNIAGGPGLDTISTGPGDDVIVARDDFRDTVNCGPGNKDSVEFNAIDVISYTSCELGESVAQVASGGLLLVVAGPGAKNSFVVEATRTGVIHVEDEGTHFVEGEDQNVPIFPIGPGCGRDVSEVSTAVECGSRSTIKHVALITGDQSDQVHVGQIFPFTASFSLDAGDGDDTVMGGPLSNTLSGGTGTDTMTGGPQRDVLAGGAGTDTLHGAAGNDDLYSNNNGSGSDTLGDFLHGDAGDDYLYGDDGPDWMTGGPGKDHMFSYAGTDLIFANEKTLPVNVYGCPITGCPIETDEADCGPDYDFYSFDTLDLARNPVPHCEAKV